MAEPATKRHASAAVGGEHGEQYLSNARGEVTAVLVPIDHWRDITASLATLHLLKSEEMRRRLRESLQRRDGVAWEEALRSLGVQEDEVAGTEDENHPV